MSTVSLLTAYCAAIIISSLVGGMLPRWLRLTHTRMQLALSFVGGVMLGAALLHLLPHAAAEMHSIERAAAWTLIGFIAMFFLERVFHSHHHDAPADEQAAEHACGHAHDHAQAHEHRGSSSGGPSQWIGALVGLGVHSVLDGVVLAAAVSTEALESPEVWAVGVTVFLVVLLHKPFDSLTLGTLMASSHASPRALAIVNVLYALLVPLGVAMFYLGMAPSADPMILGEVLAFAAGMFLCISTSDLLPELQFHTHDRMKLSIALALGLALAAGLVKLEASHHTHHHGDAHSHHQH
ncbi:MAG TPA: ZIP family metal transporter [Pirellulales bacterium]|nr:ZIP family metal transporter [Pirellulales bacterium]